MRLNRIRSDILHYFLDHAKVPDIKNNANLGGFRSLYAILEALLRKVTK
jgi:hypothetical protein